MMSHFDFGSELCPGSGDRHLRNVAAGCGLVSLTALQIVSLIAMGVAVENPSVRSLNSVETVLVGTIVTMLICGGILAGRFRQSWLACGIGLFVFSTAISAIALLSLASLWLLIPAVVAWLGVIVLATGLPLWSESSEASGKVADVELTDVAIPIDTALFENDVLETDQIESAEMEAEPSIFESDNVVQQTTRTFDDEKREVITGYFRVPFKPGQRQQVVHFPFCPPLRCAPSVSVSAMEGPEATLKPTTAERFGTRVEIRLKRPPETGQALIIEVIASETAESALGRVAS